jgi:hypothetical protein
MKYIFFILVYFFTVFNISSQERIDSFLKSIRNILNYNISGYQDMIDDNKFSYREPLSIDIPYSGLFAIRPYNVFIKCYEKNTNEIYYTRTSSMFLNIHEGYISIFNHNYFLNTVAIPAANSFKIIKKNHDYYVQLTYKNNQKVPQYGTNLAEKVLNEFKISFYRPNGKIIKNVNNMFFQFETVEEEQGFIKYDILELSNIDLIAEIRNLYAHIETINSNELETKYIEKLDFLLDFINKESNYLYGSDIIKLVISQFFDDELLDCFR